MFAGDVRAAGIPERIGAVVAYRVVPRSEGGIVLAAEGTRSYSCIHLSVEAALEAVRLVIAGEPVAPSDIDPLRLAAARAMGADSADGADPAFYTGDVHSHTFYSDGRMSPVGLALAAAYAGLDYLVISDHNTVAGAQLAARLSP